MSLFCGWCTACLCLLTAGQVDAARDRWNALGLVQWLGVSQRSHKAVNHAGWRSSLPDGPATWMSNSTLQTHMLTTCHIRYQQVRRVQHIGPLNSAAISEIGGIFFVTQVGRLGDPSPANNLHDTYHRDATLRSSSHQVELNRKSFSLRPATFRKLRRTLARAVSRRGEIVW